MKCDKLESFTAETFGDGNCEVYEADELNTVLRNKRLFKICEAVALGLKRYYMAPNNPSTITPDERALAKAYLEHLPRGWMQNGDKLPWSIVR